MDILISHVELPILKLKKLCPLIKERTMYNFTTNDAQELLVTRI